MPSSLFTHSWNFFFSFVFSFYFLSNCHNWILVSSYCILLPLKSLLPPTQLQFTPLPLNLYTLIKATYIMPFYVYVDVRLRLYVCVCVFECILFATPNFKSFQLKLLRLSRPLSCFPLVLLLFYQCISSAFIFLLPSFFSFSFFICVGIFTHFINNYVFVFFFYFCFLVFLLLIYCL